MRFRPWGDSMSPFLRRGDVVTIVPGKRCHLGDIVLVSRDESLLLHRVVAKKPGEIITKGDALSSLDRPVPLHYLLGRAAFRERRGKLRPLDSFQARFLGMAFSLTVPLLPRFIDLLAALKRLGRERLGLEQK